MNLVENYLQGEKILINIFFFISIYVLFFVELSYGNQLRTKHLNPDGRPTFTNKLMTQMSPYLLQHAHNPVNWYPWGEEAFKEASIKKVPILLSIGYSTCHWCHVMQEESFEDLEIANYINQNYIAIKVDREERPDIDSIYMQAVNIMTGSGGWPMTVWLTPDGKPIFAGTYYPARDGDRGSHTGLFTLLKKFKKNYDSNIDKVTRISNEMTEILKKRNADFDNKSILNNKVIINIIQYFEQNYDSVWGGLKGKPKFASTLPLSFLMQQKANLKMINTTLMGMIRGGMYDLVGGGFHRYSTDIEWLSPHFEKMLYDNALLVSIYLEAYQLTGIKQYAKTVKDTLEFLEKEMLALDGSFSSAIDADTLWHDGKRREGFFYTWNLSELKSALSKKELAMAKKYFGISEKGNFYNERNLLFLTHTEKKDELRSIKEKLYKLRNKRNLPTIDKKRLTSWNAMAISAFAKASFVFNDEHYLEIAIKSAEFIKNKMYIKKVLYRSYYRDKATIPGFLSDYTNYIASLIDLYEASGDIKWLKLAIEIEDVLTQNFLDEKSGGYFQTSHNAEKLLIREKPIVDSAIPPGNAIAAMNLLRLYKLTTDDKYRVRVDQLFKTFTGLIVENPTKHIGLLKAFSFYKSKGKEIILIAPIGVKMKESKLYKKLQTSFISNRVISIVHQFDELQKISLTIPFLDEKITFDNKVTAFVCEKGVCKLPTTDVEVFLQQIKD